MSADNQTILAHAATGKDPTEIGKLLGITAQSVRNVLAGFAENGVRAESGSSLLQQIQRANMPDQKWPTAELLSSFRFPTRVRNTIQRHCDEMNAPLLSLRQLLDLFIWDEQPKGRRFAINPYIDMRVGGVKGFWDAVGIISALDMGEQANALWDLRLNRLRTATRMKGLRSHSWSKPITKRKIPKRTAGKPSAEAAQV